MAILAENGLPGFFVGVAASVVAALVVGLVAVTYRSGLAPTWLAIRTFCRLYRTLGTIRMTTFVRDRADYRQFRGSDRQHIRSYIGRATRDLTLVSISLVTGVDFEGLCETLHELIERPSPVRVRISLLDPRIPALMAAIAPVLDATGEQLAQTIQSTMNRLLVFRTTLSPKGQNHFFLYFHKSIPFASAIIIDAREISGTIQIETKPYRAPLGQSLGFELRNGGKHALFQTLVSGYEKLIEDGEKYSPL